MSTITINSPISRPVAGQVRLTRRGRVVVFVAALLVVLAAALFLGATSVASQDSGTPTQTEVVVVGAGDTLWEIASDAADGGDVREMVHQIRELNALDSSVVQSGQELHVPVRG